MTAASAFFLALGFVIGYAADTIVNIVSKLIWRRKHEK